MGDTRVFIHGLESSSQGTKGAFFQKRYPDMVIEDFKGPLEERMKKLDKILLDKRTLILVGSSFGGLMATIFACDNVDKVKKLILLAPALNLNEFRPYTANRINIPVVIYHGKDDDVVPIEPVRKIASQIFANLTYNIVDDDHPLRKTFRLLNWDELLCLR